MTSPLVNFYIGGIYKTASDVSYYYENNKTGEVKEGLTLQQIVEIGKKAIAEGYTVSAPREVSELINKESM